MKKVNCRQSFLCNGKILISISVSYTHLSAFYADWVMEPGNRERLKNIISYYADVPVGFQIQVALTDEVKEPDKDAMEKMGRRLL